MLHGFILIVLPSIITPIILTGLIILPYKMGNTKNVNAFYNNLIFTPVGILQGEDD